MVNGQIIGAVETFSLPFFCEGPDLSVLRGHRYSSSSSRVGSFTSDEVPFRIKDEPVRPATALTKRGDFFIFGREFID